MMRVLVAENNLQSLTILCDLLEKEGFETLKARDGQEAFAAYRHHKPDFICLDIMMPSLDGFEVCKKIREENDKVPIIFISSKSTTSDKASGLELGADDYIVKPFDIIEVTARIRAVARRCLTQTSQEQKNDYFTLADLKIYPNKLKAERAGRSIDLSLRDVKILKLFSDKKNEVVDRNLLLDHCWGAHIMPESRTIDWYMSQLRKKIEEDPRNPQIIQTIHGAGYIFKESA